jgi:hypothetical protein
MNVGVKRIEYLIDGVRQIDLNDECDIINHCETYFQNRFRTHKLITRGEPLMQGYLPQALFFDFSRATQRLDNHGHVIHKPLNGISNKMPGKDHVIRLTLKDIDQAIFQELVATIEVDRMISVGSRSQNYMVTEEL